MSSVASVKDRLKNKSRSTGKTMQELLTAYDLERSIYRLSKSRYKEHFILKGGIFCMHFMTVAMPGQQRI